MEILSIFICSYGLQSVRTRDVRLITKVSRNGSDVIWTSNR